MGADAQTYLDTRRLGLHSNTLDRLCQTPIVRPPCAVPRERCAAEDRVLRVEEVFLEGPDEVRAGRDDDFELLGRSESDAELDALEGGG